MSLQQWTVHSRNLDAMKTCQNVHWMSISSAAKMCHTDVLIAAEKLGKLCYRFEECYFYTFPQLCTFFSRLVEFFFRVKFVGHQGKHLFEELDIIVTFCQVFTNANGLNYTINASI